MIVINARFLTQKITGVQRYALEICKRLPNKIAGRDVIFVSPKIENTSLIDFKLIQIGTLKGQLWEQVDLPIYLKKNGSPLLINFVGIGPVLYTNKIMFLYDLAFKHHPEWFSYAFQKAYNLLIPLSIKNCKTLVTDSNYVKQDIISTYQFKNEIEVIYAAPSLIFEDKKLEREKIILMVSSLDPRKNMKRVIEAFLKLDIPHKLVIVGAKGTAFSDLNMEEDYNSNRVVFSGYLEDEALVNLYNTSELFVYASLFEGFGIPPLEAQVCGTPCLVSNVTSLPEVYGDSVEYCNPYDVEHIKSKISLLLNNKEKRTELREAGFLNTKKYNWDSATKAFIHTIKKIC